uniref:Uncharacterized protein n=1 Tax=Lutzomyia longipalpis TaxID=7200 RepID=A0A1B0C8Y8_LUTLO
MWNDFRVTSNDEVTINNTLCSIGLFQIASTTEVTTSPKVHAAVQNGKIYVAVDQILVLLENENVGECKFLSFPETQIDCVFISDSGKLVVCCLANGTINGFCITGRPLFNLKIEEEDIGEEKSFVGISADGPDLYIMCRNGRLYKVGTVDEDKSMSLIENNETLVFDESITSSAQISRISSRKFYNEVISFIMIPCDDAPMAVCCDTTRIYVYSNGDFLPISLQEEQHGGIKKLHLIGLSPWVVTTSPKVHAAVQNGKIYVAVDQILVLLENENVGECKFLSFPETQIDCVFISDSGKLVVCCLANGTINGFCITGRPLFNLKIEEEDIGEEKTFVGISADGPDLYIMCRNGRLYKVGSVDEDKSMSLIENNETLVFDESITSSAQISRISSRKFYNEVISFIMIPCDDAPMAVCCDTTRIYVYSDGDFLPISLQEEQHGGIKKLHLIRNYLLGLCHNGSIVEICPYTGMVYNMSTEADCRIDDMVLMESTDEKIELMILTKPTSIGEKFLKIVDFPSMASLYDLDMSKHIWLVDQPKSPMGMYYLIGDGESTVPQEIEMKIISETLPQHQLMKMISRGRLEEAEEFAVQFNLSLEPIHEHRLKRHITKMAQCRNTEALRVEFRDFLQLLDKINNVGKVLAMWDIGIPNR